MPERGRKLIGVAGGRGGSKLSHLLRVCVNRGRSWAKRLGAKRLEAKRLQR